MIIRRIGIEVMAGMEEFLGHPAQRKKTEADSDCCRPVVEAQGFEPWTKGFTDVSCMFPCRSDYTTICLQMLLGTLNLLIL